MKQIKTTLKSPQQLNNLQSLHGLIKNNATKYTIFEQVKMGVGDGQGQQGHLPYWVAYLENRKRKEGIDEMRDPKTEKKNNVDDFIAIIRFSFKPWKIQLSYIH